MDTPLGTTASPPPPPPSPRTARPWLRPVAWVAGALGLLLVGATAGQLLFPRTVVEPGAVPTVVAEPIATAAPVAPDVLGLDEATARRVLSDAGLAVEVVTTTAPAAGPEGLVVAQDPLPGDEPGPTVTLTLATTIAVPAGAVGVGVEEARTVLESLGAVVRVTRTVDPTAREGVVLSADPAPGQPLGTTVTLVVAEAGEGVLLTQLRRVDSTSCSSVSEGTINGAVVQDSVVCDEPSSEPRTAGASWVLARSGSVLEATLGMLDRGEQGTAVLRVIGDDRLLSETPVAYGGTAPLRVDVRGVLRVRIEVQITGGDPTVVVGDGRVVGTAEQVAALLAAQ